MNWRLEEAVGGTCNGHLGFKLPDRNLCLACRNDVDECKVHHLFFTIRDGCDTCLNVRARHKELARFM